MKKEVKAYLTLYLCLIMGILLTITFTILSAVREEVIRMEIESVMEISLFSVFGEYHKELLQRYDLFSIDSGYGGKKEENKKVEEHLQYYLNENFHKNNSFMKKELSLTGLHCADTSLEEYCLLSDEKGQVLKEAILEYMKDKRNVTLINHWKEEFGILQEIEEGSLDLEGEWERLSGEINQAMEGKEEAQEEELSIPENPTDYVREKKEEGILGLALPPGKEISARRIQKKDYISNRNYSSGTGRLKGNNRSDDSLLDKTLLQEYLFEKNGNFQKENQESYLKYQIEYLLYGEEEDKKNLEKTLERILLGREAINFTYLMTDKEKQAEAEALAVLISVACMIPELKDSVKLVVLFAWSYAESVKDIRILLDGKKVPLLKDRETWNTPLSQLLSFTSHLGEYYSTEEGIDYEDHLKMFLFTEKEESVLMRFMDLCEMDIRFITDNPGFAMDQCITMLKARAHISSSYGGDYQITRTWYYE